jgi:hypothetical protein
LVGITLLERKNMSAEAVGNFLAIAIRKTLQTNED